jgi:membrane protease YdiL (CAAX protease family)
MSIVSLLCDTSVRGAGGLTADWWLVLLLAVSFAAAVLAGVVPPRKINGPDRIAPGRPAWLLLAVMFGAVGVYILSGNLYLTIKYQVSGKPPATQPQDLTSVDTAVENTVPPLCALLVMVLGDSMVRETTGQDLGFGLRRASRGLLWGLLGVVIVVPPLYLFIDVLESVYQRVHYIHPTEHPLLKLLGEKPPIGVVIAIVIAACVIAPPFEELLFRGHLQTLLRRMFHRMANRRPLSTGAEDAMSLPPPTAPQTWAAIAVTSLIFASVHPTWSMPVIFVLALCLGYAYERTGNLWVSITIHAGFNTISTVIFLTTLYAR